jgi:8-oxo-dGTP pyrophosphatase MutT (NUDIX family)
VTAAAGPNGRTLYERVLEKILQRVWRIQRGMTLGAQGMVFDADQRVLLIRHTYRPGWHFPGGGVEPGESVRLSLARELEEEAGVLISKVEPQLLGLFTNFVRFPGDHIAVFVVRDWQQPRVPAPNREIAEQGFFAIDALPEGTSAGARRRIDEVMRGATGDGTW